MSSAWVDFKKVKEAVDMQMALDHYGIRNLTKNGDELRGPCPIHKGSGRSKDFTVNVRKNAFRCFSAKCKTKGNVLDFVAAMEQCQIVDAAILLDEWFKVGEHERTLVQVPVCQQRSEVPRGIYTDSKDALFEVIANATSEDLELLVVYRELFGEYKCWVASRENFGEEKSTFTLIRPL